MRVVHKASPKKKTGTAAGNPRGGATKATPDAEKGRASSGKGKPTKSQRRGTLQMLRKEESEQPAAEQVVRPAASLKSTPDEGWFRYARNAEADGEIETAIDAYEKLIGNQPHHEQAYDRLLILLRRRQELNKEWKVLQQAIQSLEKWYAAPGKLRHSSRIASLSRSLSTSTGLLDKKGKPTHQPGPLPKWYRRRELLKKKLGK